MLRLATSTACIGLWLALGSSGCETFEVGPDAFELYEDPATCDASVLDQDGRCRRFDFDNPDLAVSDQPVPVHLRFGFEAPRRDLELAWVRFEPVGAAPVERPCAFENEVADVSGLPPLQCVTATLLGGQALPDEAETGVIDVDLDVTFASPGPHALSVWLSDELELESPVLRWQFSVAAAPEE